MMPDSWEEWDSKIHRKEQILVNTADIEEFLTSLFWNRIGGGIYLRRLWLILLLPIHIGWRG